MSPLFFSYINKVLKSPDINSRGAHIKCRKRKKCYKFSKVIRVSAEVFTEATENQTMIEIVIHDTYQDKRTTSTTEIRS